MSKSRNRAMFKNSPVYLYYLNKLKEYALSCFKWENLPNTVDERFLELSLLEKGYAIFFYDDILGYLTLGGSIGGEQTVYRVPMDRTAIAPNGYQNNLTDKNSVIIFNNYLRTPTFITCEMYAEQLYELDRTILTNIKSQKTPIILKSSQNEKLTMENIYLDYDSNVPVIKVSNDLDINNLTALTTNAPFISDKLMDIKYNIWNEALIALGIDGNISQKKERENIVESYVPTKQSKLSRLSYLNARKQACKEINNMFHLNIDVNYNADDNIINEIEVGDIGSLYNRVKDNFGEREFNIVK